MGIADGAAYVGLAPVKARHTCPICGRPIALSHFKRHVNAHERRGYPTPLVNRAWVAFVDRYAGNGADLAAAGLSSDLHARIAAVRRGD